MQGNKPRRHFILALAVTVLFALITLLNLWFHFSEVFQYRYLKIGDRYYFTIYLLISLVPLVFAVIGSIAAFRRRKRLLIISAALFIGVILSTFLFLLGLFLFEPVFVSSTDEIKNYGKVDTAWNSFESNGGNFENTGFPKEIPADAENPHYFYWYANLASEHFFYTASWEQPEESFDRELLRLKDYGYPINERDALYSLEKETQSWTTQVLIDRDRNMIAYFAVRGMGLSSLPKSLEEFYATDYSSKLILENDLVK